MYAQCPICSTVYQVTAADLTVERGRMYCSFCDKTFDAFASLTDHPTAHAPAAAGLSESDAQEHPDDPEAERDDQDYVIEAGAESQPPEAFALIAAPEDAIEAAAATEEAAAHTDVGSEIAVEQVAAGTTAPGDVPASAPDSEVTAVVVAPIDSVPTAVAEATPSTSDSQPESVASTADTSAPAQSDADALDLDELRGIRRRPWARAWWSVAAVLMLLLLAAQAVHRSRSELTLNPSIAPWMYHIYGALGAPLDPNWDVGLYRFLRRSEMAAVVADDGAAQLRLTAMLTNDAARPQPYPLVRLTLEDRWGSAVGARDFTPQEYLHDDARAARLLAPGEQARVELLVVDPGADTVGFALDACLADVHGVVRCANDAS